ncbi:hypothetical protein Q3G72_000785 [Acer saccharum]|nr:hypothetical protein Q3G72_000785 [Acer saccharum]
MEDNMAPEPTKKQNKRFPPKRGQVMINILKEIFGRSAAAKRRENGLGGLSSSSTTPAATPRLYNSDDEFKSGEKWTLFRLEKEQYRHLPPRRGQIKIKIFKEMFETAASATTTTTASGESQEDNGGQQQRSTSPFRLAALQLWSGTIQMLMCQSLD